MRTRISSGILYLIIEELGWLDIDLPAFLHIGRFIHSDCHFQFDFLVIAGTFCCSHCVPFVLAHSTIGRQCHLEYKMVVVDYNYNYSVVWNSKRTTPLCWIGLRSKLVGKYYQNDWISFSTVQYIWDLTIKISLNLREKNIELTEASSLSSEICSFPVCSAIKRNFNEQSGWFVVHSPWVSQLIL